MSKLLNRRLRNAKKKRRRSYGLIQYRVKEEVLKCIYVFFYFILRTKQNLKELYESCKVEDTYTGLTIPLDGKINQKWIEDLIENMRSNKFIHKKYLLQILLNVREIYQNKQSLIDIIIPDDQEFTVCGDIHGQFYDLLNIFNINGNPSNDNPYLFNGDFVDRGAFSVECITALLCYKLLYPESFHLARGNHESRNLNKLYGFEGEVKAKYDLSVYESFCEFFHYLPLAHVLNNKILVVHGGLFSSDGVKLDDIKKVNRFCEPPEKGIMSEILWSDPCKENGRQPSKRGVGLSFGPDIAAKFLDDNKLELLVRSHEVKQEGYEVEPGERVITVFSAPNYCDQMGNKGALIRFKGKEMKPRFVQYTAVDHPKVAPMRYMNPMMFI